MVSTPNDHCQGLHYKLEQNLSNIFEMSMKHKCEITPFSGVLVINKMFVAHLTLNRSRKCGGKSWQVYFHCYT